jgi:hypothetical protein
MAELGGLLSIGDALLIWDIKRQLRVRPRKIVFLMFFIITKNEDIFKTFSSAIINLVLLEFSIVLLEL